MMIPAIEITTTSIGHPRLIWDNMEIVDEYLIYISYLITKLVFFHFNSYLNAFYMVAKEARRISIIFFRLLILVRYFRFFPQFVVRSFVRCVLFAFRFIPIRIPIPIRIRIHISS